MGPMLDPRRIEVLDDAMVEVLRAKTGAERQRIANEMFRMAQRMIRSSLRARHPDWDEERLPRETARRISHGDISISLERAIQACETRTVDGSHPP